MRSTSGNTYVNTKTSDTKKLYFFSRERRVIIYLQIGIIHFLFYMFIGKIHFRNIVSNIKFEISGKKNEHISRSRNL